MQKRIALWDNIKFVMITLMVLGHFADVFVGRSVTCKSIYLFIYAFHIPLLLFISDMFYHAGHTREKALFFMSCGFLMKILYTCIPRLFTEHALSFSLLSDSFIPWYMFSLSIYLILMHYLKDLNLRYILIANILLACFLGYDKTIGDYLYLSRTIIFFPFFIAGTLADPEKICRWKERHAMQYLIPSVVILGVWFYLCFAHIQVFYPLRHLFTGRNAFISDIVSWGALLRLLCYLITVLTSFSIIMLIPSGEIKGVTQMGTKTLNVYFWHWPIYLILNRLFKIKLLFLQGALGKILFLLTPVLLSVVISSVEFFDWPLKQIRRECFRKVD